MARVIVEDVATDQAAVAVAAFDCRGSRDVHGAGGICATWCKAGGTSIRENPDVFVN